MSLLGKNTFFAAGKIQAGTDFRHTFLRQFEKAGTDFRLTFLRQFEKAGTDFRLTFLRQFEIHPFARIKTGR